MGLLGNGWDDPQSNAVMQLAGGLLSGNFGQGAAAYGSTMAGAKDPAMRRQYLQSQMDDHASQIEARKLAGVKDARQQALVESMFGGSVTGSPAGTAAGAPFGGGAPAAGEAARAPGLLELARQYGIPEQAIQADMVFNGGKKISELLAERSKPNWQNIGGNLVNTNEAGFKGGFQPQVSFGTDGRATMAQPDGQGGLVVGAPRGALDTYRSYQGAGAAFKPIKVYNPETGREEYTNEGAVVGGQGGQGGSLPNNATAPGAWTAANPGQPLLAARPGESDKQGIYAQALAQAQQQLTQARTPEEKARAQSDIDGIQGEMKRSGISTPPLRAVGNFAAGPSAAEASQAKANDTYQNSRATARAESDNQDAMKSKQFVDFRSQLNIAKSLLDTNPTASPMGSVVDKVGGWMGANVPGAESAASLKTAAAWLVQNIPKAPGAQSEAELRDYKAAVGQVGDDTVPVPQRKAALKTAEGMINMWEGRAGGKLAADQPKPAGTAFDAKPPAQQFTGKTMTGPDGKRYKSDGMIWKEVQ